MFFLYMIMIMIMLWLDHYIITRVGAWDVILCIIS